ncbi:ATP-binding protein [Myxococcus sp. RHSTA-1-4]|uniref:ATP-binding protein n=1 Tax=Myxococcus sp. RHSTA-1-4 TaxID=2874601 RepID=UPI001CBC6DD3|nr:ATP-binding protein [Myxococcus sp. RHSTA-1-4]MBZ4419227.1 response regulator [Myxococcus sp. RHSTA-1-4]
MTTGSRLSRRSVVLAAGALLLLCGLFMTGRPWAVSENDRYRTTLRQLSVASAELEQDVLRARLGLPEVHGSAAPDFAALRARAEALRDFPSFLPEQDRQTLAATLDAYVRALGENESLLARSRDAQARGEPRESNVLLQAMLERGASAEAERLINTYVQLYARAQVRNERSRVAFFLVSLLLGAYVLVVLVRLSRASGELATLNTDLERRVEERTAALSTANEELRASEARKAAILEAAPDGILLLDGDGRLLELNPAAERTFRLSSAQAHGRDFLALALPASLPAGERERVAAALDAPSGRPTRLESPCQRADGSVFPSELTLTRVPGDGPRRFTAFVRDITERREVERMKNEFISTVSHELRTPLTSIRGSLGLLEGGIVGELPPQALDMVRIARTNTERLIRLINDILDLEKMDAGKLELKLAPLECAEWVEAALSGVRGMADTAGVPLRSEVEGAPRVKGDRDRLIQVLTNLVSNAVKFSPRGAPVTVRVREEAGGRVRFSVVDQGPGIPAEQRGRLFGRFQQLDGSDTRSKGGTGLGLAISQAIVDQHGGRIEVESEEGKGSTFTFSLEAAKSVASEAPAAVPRDESRYNVLVATADGELSTLLRGLLSHEGYRVVRAASLAEAAEVLEASPPDALVVDTRMPDGQALDWVRRLREQPRTRELPVLALSGRSAEDEGVGMPLWVDWMTKPLEETRLLEALRYAMRQPGQARVLVVDDDAATRRVLCARLERLGVQVFEAADGESAVALARETTPDLIVLDVGLPRLDGFEVVDILRQGKGRATPLIVFTGRELSSTDQRQLTLGITRHLTKARSSEEELVSSVRELLNGLLTRREAAAAERKAVS